MWHSCWNCRIVFDLKNIFLPVAIKILASLHCLLCTPMWPAVAGWTSVQWLGRGACGIIAGLVHVSVFLGQHEQLLLNSLLYTVPTLQGGMVPIVPLQKAAPLSAKPSMSSLGFKLHVWYWHVGDGESCLPLVWMQGMGWLHAKTALLGVFSSFLWVHGTI